MGGLVWLIALFLRTNLGVYANGNGRCRRNIHTTNAAALAATSGIICAVLPRLLSHMKDFSTDMDAWNIGAFVSLVIFCTTITFTFWKSTYRNCSIQGVAGSIAVGGLILTTTTVGFHLFPIDNLIVPTS